MSRWLDRQPRKFKDSPKTDVTKVTKMIFGTFGTSTSGKNKNFQGISEAEWLEASRIATLEAPAPDVSPRIAIFESKPMRIVRTDDEILKAVADGYAIYEWDGKLYARCR